MFAPVQQVFGEAPQLALEIAHCRERAAERRVPIDLIESFRPPDWDLVLVETRQDSGRLVSTT